MDIQVARDERKLLGDAIARSTYDPFLREVLSRRLPEWYSDMLGQLTVLTGGREIRYADAALAEETGQGGVVIIAGETLIHAEITDFKREPNGQQAATVIVRAVSLKAVREARVHTVSPIDDFWPDAWPSQFGATLVFEGDLADVSLPLDPETGRGGVQLAEIVRGLF